MDREGGDGFEFNTQKKQTHRFKVINGIEKITFKKHGRIPSWSASLALRIY